MKNNLPNINFEEILHQIQEQQKNIEGLTSQEVASSLGVSIKTARDRIKMLMENGFLQYKGKAFRINMCNQTHKVPIYAFTQKARKEFKLKK